MTFIVVIEWDQKSICIFNNVQQNWVNSIQYTVKWCQRKCLLHFIYHHDYQNWSQMQIIERGEQNEMKKNEP